MIQEIIGEMLGEDQTLEYPTQPTIVMVIGVNGAGKTTTIGKLCHQLKGRGQKGAGGCGGYIPCCGN